MLSKLKCVRVGDYNCNVVDDSSLWSLLLSAFGSRYLVLPKDKDFTFVYTSG